MCNTHCVFVCQLTIKILYNFFISLTLTSFHLDYNSTSTPGPTLPSTDYFTFFFRFPAPGLFGSVPTCRPVSGSCFEPILHRLRHSFSLNRILQDVAFLRHQITVPLFVCIQNELFTKPTKVFHFQVLLSLLFPSCPLIGHGRRVRSFCQSWQW